MTHIFFLSLFFASALTFPCSAEEIPFAPFDKDNAVSLEYLELYKENPQNATIPEDILAILQNKNSLEPPTIVRQAPSYTQESTFFSYKAPVAGKINSPYLPMINEIAKDPVLLQNIPLDELNKLILESTQNHNRNLNVLKSTVLGSSTYHAVPEVKFSELKNPYFTQLSDLQKLKIVAAKTQINDAEPNRETELTDEEILKTGNPQFSATDEALTAIKLEELEEKAKNDDEDAKILLARAYFNGTGGHKNIDRAFSLMEENARRGSTLAMLELGKMYEADSPRYNIMRAANYYKQASDYGNIDGKYHLGLLYYKGKFGQGDDALKHAIYAFREAAAKDHAPSMFELATMYEKGVGFQKDMGQAVQLYRKSAHLGYAPSQLQVGLLYENGILVPKNETLAAAWYTKAAEQRHPTAQYLLAGLYRQGKGVPQNLAQARILYENAASFGLVDAQYDLGIFYLLKTEFQDYRKAEYWLQKAADQNDTQAREILIQLQQKLSNKMKEK